MITIITGERGAGKTTLLGLVIESVAGSGRSVAGILTLPRLNGDIKIGMDVLDLRRGERRPLAERRPPDDIRCEADPLIMCAWQFDPDGLAWGDEVLRSSLPCDLLVIDELGPLELLRGAGWQSGLAALHSQGYGQALVVVRPSLIETFRAQFPTATATILVNEDTRDALATSHNWLGAAD